MAQDNYKEEIIINKTVGEVFEFVSVIRNFPLWVGASGVKVVSEIPSRVGSKYEIIFSTLLTRTSIPVEIMEYSFPHTFSFRDNSKMILFHYVFEQVKIEIDGEVKDGAKVTLRCELDDKPFSFSRLRMDNLLEDLKKYLEIKHEV